MGKNHQVKSHDRSIKSKKSGFIRLISGKWRGKKLAVLNIEGLRPTTNRTKETLFNWLMYDIHNARCLDCFSGSGSLAFEALSRSAQSVTLLERDKQVCQQLKLNLQSLKVENALVIETDSISYLQQRSTQPFNIVFIDPPFNKSLLQPCCDALENNAYLAKNALIYVEMEKKIDLFTPPSSWELIKEKSTGQVIYQLYKKTN